MKNIYFALFFAIIIAVGVFVINIQQKEIKSLRSEKNTLIANNNLLLDNLRRSYNDKMEIARTNEQLKNAIRNDKSGFDWHYDLSSNPVLLEFKRLHAN